jgi:hypothetical protein
MEKRPTRMEREGFEKMNDGVFGQESVRLIRRIVRDEVGEALDGCSGSHKRRKRTHPKNFTTLATPREFECYCLRSGHRITIVDGTCCSLDRGRSCGGCDFDRNRIITRLVLLLASDLREHALVEQGA